MAIWLTPMLFMIGLSGLLIVRAKESVTKGGTIYRGKRAITDGIFYMLIGWGGCIFIALAAIFHWQ